MTDFHMQYWIVSIYRLHRIDENSNKTNNNEEIE